MAEKITIAQLDIDLDAVIKRSGEYQRELGKLKAEQRQLRKDTANLTDATDDQAKTFAENDARIRNLNKNYRDSQALAQSLVGVNEELITTNIQEGTSVKEVVDARRQLIKINNQIKGNTEEEIEFRENLNNVIDAQTAFIRDNSSEYGKGKDSIGEYREAISDTIGETTLYAKVNAALRNTLSPFVPLYNSIRGQVKGAADDILRARKNTEGYTLAQKASAVATNLTSGALKLLKIALVSTGIGAILVALGSLIAFFARTQKGIDLVNQVLAGLGAAFDVIIDRISKVGGALVKLFTGDFSGAFNDLKDAASGLGDELLREVGLAIKLEKVFQEVERKEIDLSIRRAATNKQLKELNKIIEDQSKTEQERIAAAQKFAKLEEELVADEIANQERLVAAKLAEVDVNDEVRESINRIAREGLSLDQLGLSESTLEDAKEFRDEINKLFDLQTRSFEVQTTNQNKLNTLRKQIRSEEVKRAQEAIDAAIKESKVRLDIFIEENEGRAETLREALTFEEEVRDQRLKILEEELKAGKRTRLEFQLEQLRINKDFLEAQADLTIANAERELESFIALNQSRLADGQLLNDELVAMEVARIEAIAEKEREFQQQRLEQGVISQQQFNDAIDEVNARSQEKRDQLEATRKEQEEQRQVVERAAELELQLLQTENDFERRALRLENQRQQEVANAEAIGADITAINKKYAKQQEDIEKALQLAKIQSIASGFGAIRQLVGESSALGKAAGIAQASVDTYVAANNALSSLAPWPLPQIFSGIAIAQGLANVAKIGEVDTSFEQGGLSTVGGKRHSQGGTRYFGEDGNAFEAERGELIGVMNRRAAAHFMAFNNLYRRGVPIRAKYQSGGVFSPELTAASTRLRTPISASNNGTPEFDYSKLAVAVREGYMSASPPVLDVQEFTDIQSDMLRVQSGADV